MASPSTPVTRLAIDMACVQRAMLHLLRIPSPTGRTDEAVQFVGEQVHALGMDVSVTRRGLINAVLPVQAARPDRAIAVHADTIGCMVTQLQEDGQLRLTQVGTHSSRFAEGSRTTIFTDSGTAYTGTVLPLKASGHQCGDEVDTQGVGWSLVELRVDERVEDRAGLERLGIQVGDHVALDARPEITPSGYVVSRHLDDKAGIAAVLGAFRAVIEAGITPLVGAHLLVRIAEEVGHGATHGLDPDVVEVIAVDNAVVAPGQQSREDRVNVAMIDQTGPFDYHFSRKLLSLAAVHCVPHTRDTYRHYRSDAASAVEAGLEMRTALVGFGVDSSYGHERTHLDSLRGVAEPLALYLQSDLTFPEWDRDERGPLEEFPSRSVQPVVLHEPGRIATEAQPS